MKTEGLSINLATVRMQYGLKDGVEAYVKHGVRGISPWREHVQAVGVDEAARIIKSNGMKVTGYCRGGLFGSADASGQQALIDDNKRMIYEGAAIGADCLVMIGGGMAPGSRDIKAARGRYLDGMTGAPRAEEDAFLAAHSDIYHRAANGRVRVTIRDGAISIGSLDTPGLGVGPLPDFESMIKSPLPNPLPQAGEGAHRAHA